MFRNAANNLRTNGATEQRHPWKLLSSFQKAGGVRSAEMLYEQEARVI